MWCQDRVTPSRRLTCIYVADRNLKKNEKGTFWTKLPQWGGGALEIVATATQIDLETTPLARV